MSNALKTLRGLVNPTDRRSGRVIRVGPDALLVSHGGQTTSARRLPGDATVYIAGDRVRLDGGFVRGRVNRVSVYFL